MKEGVDFVHQGQFLVKLIVAKGEEDIQVDAGLSRGGRVLVEMDGGGICCFDGAKGPSRVFNRASGSGGAVWVRWTASDNGSRKSTWRTDVFSHH